MEIQQKEKESLAAYIHHFKREASRYKFDNDATIIRIFIKGLKNAHTLATVKVQDMKCNKMCGWYIILRQFLDNSGSPLYSGAVITEDLM